MSWRLILKYLKVKREKSTSDKGHYIRNADLLPAVIEAKQLGFVTNRLSKMFFKIADRYSHKHTFVKYSFREDMVASAVANLCQNALKFNHEKYSNPFAYYTTAVHNSFLQFLNDEKRQREVRDRLLLDAGSNPSYNFLEGEKDESHFEQLESDEVDYVPEAELGTLEEYEAAQAQGLEQPEGGVKLQHVSRLPGEVKKYGPSDIIIDAVTGAITVIKKEEKPVAEEKKARKPRAKKVEAVEDAPAKPSRAKKTVSAVEPISKARTKKLDEMFSKINKADAFKLENVAKTITKAVKEAKEKLKPAAKKTPAKTVAKKTTTTKKVAK